MISLVRKYHKWLMAFVGIQFLFWSITGGYMVTMDIHYIHGESLIESEPSKLDLSGVSYSINDLVTKYPTANDITLSLSMGNPVYIFTHSEKDKFTVDATTGLQLPAVDEIKAKEIALYHYAQPHDVDDVKLISTVSEMPAELSARHLPVWRIIFDSFETPTLYISQRTGSLVAKRHDYWRLFDWMWRFHIMDYDDGENVSNWFLFLVTTLSLLAAISGAVLTYFRVFSSNKEGNN